MAHPRQISRTNWRAQVFKICRHLGTFTVADVSRELRDKARPKIRREQPLDRLRYGGIRDDYKGQRIPTDKQLAQYLARVEWALEITPGQPHKHTIYQFRELGEMLKASSETQGDDNNGH